MIVYLSEYIHPVPRKQLEQEVTIVDNFDDIRNIDAILLRRFRVDEAFMQKAKNLKLVAVHGVGYDMVDLEAAKRHGIAVTNTPQANSDSVAELVTGLVIDLERNILQANRACHRDLVKSSAPAELKGYSIHGKTFGQIAIGNVGSRVGKIMKNAFGMNVLAYDPYVPDERFAELGFTRVSSLEELIRNSDVVNVSTCLNEETRDLISGEMFDWFKPHAVLVNAARGGIVNEHGLYEALKEGKIKAAACDVFEQEPPNSQNPLLSLENFISTPHLGANTEEATRNMAQMAVDEILRLKRGEPYLNRVV